MLNTGTLTQLVIGKPSRSSVGNRQGGEQNHLRLILRAAGNQHPHRLGKFGETNLEPAQLDRDEPFYASMRGGRLERHRQVSAGSQIKEPVGFSAVKTRIVDLNVAIVLGAENAVGVRQTHDQSEELLVVRAAIAYQTHWQVREERMGDAYSPLDLPILTDKVQRVAEPVGVSDDGNAQIGHGGGDSRIAFREPRLPIQSRGCAFVDRRNPKQLLGIRLLEIDQTNGYHESLGPLLAHLPLRDGIEALQE